MKIVLFATTLSVISPYIIATVRRIYRYSLMRKEES